MPWRKRRRVRMRKKAREEGLVDLRFISEAIPNVCDIRDGVLLLEMLRIDFFFGTQFNFVSCRGSELQEERGGKRGVDLLLQEGRC